MGFVVALEVEPMVVEEVIWEVALETLGVALKIVYKLLVS